MGAARKGLVVVFVVVVVVVVVVAAVRAAPTPAPTNTISPTSQTNASGVLAKKPSAHSAQAVAL